MAKTKRVRRYRSKGKWSSNITFIPSQNINFAPNTTSYGVFTLCENPAQSNASVSQQYTVKNIYFNFEMETNSAASATNIECLTGFIMFVPQGMTVNANYPKQHPEYIMAMRFYGSPIFETSGTDYNNNGVRNPLSIKTRLSRRLNTGDSIIFLLTGDNQNASTQMNLQINGVIRWWTKAN